MRREGRRRHQKRAEQARVRAEAWRLPRSAMRMENPRMVRAKMARIMRQMMRRN